MSPERSARHGFLTMLLFLLLAANLRPAITAVGPLVADIQAATGLSGAAVGLLNSLPPLAFAGFAPLAHFAGRLGVERTLAAAMLLLLAGILVRSSGPVSALFAGTVMLAAGIAIGNVLAPSILKRDYPDRVRTLTTVYAVALSSSAALASGLAVPLAIWLESGWRGSLAVWAIPALIATIAWTPGALRRATPAPPDEVPAAASATVWRSPVAWFVTGFMGMQSLGFYVTIAWLPTVYQSEGHDPAEAGLLITVFQLVSLAASAAIPLLIGRRKDQSMAAVAASLAMAAGVTGFLSFPAGAYVWIIVMGWGSGTCFPLALAFIGLRSTDHREAASLSLMAQSIGYLLASLGPLLFGLIHDLAGSWTLPLAGLVALTIVQAFIGYQAGRNRTVAAPRM